MKLKKELIHYLSRKIILHLKDVDAIEFDGAEDEAVEIVEGAVTSDLMVEDRLNDEVKDILQKQEQSIDENNINYRKMFQMVKVKLAKERGLIL